MEALSSCGVHPPLAKHIIDSIGRGMVGSMFTFKDFKALNEKTISYVEKDVWVDRECFWDDLRKFICGWSSSVSECIHMTARGSLKRLEWPIGLGESRTVLDVMEVVGECDKATLDTRDSRGIFVVDVRIEVCLQTSPTTVILEFEKVDINRCEYRGGGDGQ